MKEEDRMKGIILSVGTDPVENAQEPLDQYFTVLGFGHEIRTSSNNGSVCEYSNTKHDKLLRVQTLCQELKALLRLDSIL